jgi:hypothetical protein
MMRIVCEGREGRDRVHEEAPDFRLGPCTVGGGRSVHCRGLHSSTFQLNLSALYGIGVARRGCVSHVKGVLGGVQGV